MIILSIDIGSVNFGYSRWSRARGFYDFGVINLKKQKGDMPTRIHALWKRGFFEGADIICVERQMRAKFKEAVVAIRCLGTNFEKTKVVAPQCVKRHFSTSKLNHRLNKQAHVQLARSFLSEEELARLKTFKKIDDICDCVVQSVYFAEKNGLK